MVKPLKRGRAQIGKVWFALSALCLVATLQFAIHKFSHLRPEAPAERQAAVQRLHKQTSRLRGPVEPWASGSRWEQSASLVRAVRAGLTDHEQSELEALCGRCVWHSLQTCVRVRGLGESTFVATGDIDDMWLRDSSVQLAIYLPRVVAHPALRGVFEGMLRSQAFYILQDPYANSFKPRWRGLPDWPSKADRGTGKSGWVAERKYEIDSGAYFLSALWNYYATPGLRRPETLLQEPAFLEAAWAVMHTLQTEQQHNESSSYVFSELPNSGRGSSTSYTGMSWSGFRPSDDATKYGYNIPGNMYAVAALERAVQLNADVWQDADFERAASQLVTAMRAGIDKHGIVEDTDGQKIYAYEVDGRGNILSGFDDPNMPSLLGVPLLGYKYYDPQVYANTRARILDAATNKLYYKGDKMEGLGSTHTPPGHVWPLAMMVEGLTSASAERRIALLRQLLQLQCGDGLMHESVSVHDVGKCTRPWFEWANAMLVVFAENALGMDCSSAAEKHRLAQIQEREAASGAQEDPLFFETLEASIRHTWVDKSSYETYAQVLASN